MQGAAHAAGRACVFILSMMFRELLMPVFRGSMQASTQRRGHGDALGVPAQNLCPGWRLLLLICLLGCALPVLAAPDWKHWQAEFSRLQRSSLPEEAVRAQFDTLKAQLPPDPPYAVQRELAKVRIQLADTHEKTSEERKALRELALRNGDRDTAYLMQIGDIFDSHSDDNIEVSLRALDQVRLDTHSVSAEVRETMAMAYAYMYWDVGSFELALRHLLEAWNLRREVEDVDPALIVERAETLARLYVDMSDVSQALVMLDRADRDMPSSISLRQRTHLVATRGAAYRLSGRVKDAVDLMLPWLDRMPKGDPTNATQRLRQELARAYLQLGQTERAKAVATAMIDASASGSPYFKAEGEILQGAADAALGHVDAGLATMQIGLDYFEKAAHIVALQEGLRRKVEVLSAANRDHEAFVTLKKQHDLMLRMYDSNRAHGVASLQVEEGIARREREIRDLSSANTLQQARLEQERTRNVALLLASLLAIGLVVLLALLLYASRQQRKALWKDALTGAFNRHYFPHWLRKPRQHAGMVRAVALLDLDHFKTINDRHGHAAGDAVLHQVGHRLREGIDKHGEVFRWGGEEFLLVQDLPVQTDVEGWLRGLLGAFGPAISHAGESLQVSASIGCVLIPISAKPDANTFECASRIADLDMYQAKTEGRGRAVWLVMTDAGNNAWPWIFNINSDTVRNWQAKGWLDARTVLPQGQR